MPTPPPLPPTPPEHPPEAPPAVERHFPCGQCGADLKFEPGTSSLKCPYCGHVNPIAVSADGVEELDYRTYLLDLSNAQETQDLLTVKCDICGAESELKPNIVSDECPFCGSSIVATGRSSRRIKPGCLLPFHIRQDQANQRFRQWLDSRWFAPGDLKKHAESHPIKGIYMPCWTYDSRTVTRYRGERGVAYYETQSYTTMVNGKSVRRTRQVRKIRWYPASGTVRNEFDDLLVPASQSLPRHLAEALEPWDLSNMVAYDDQYLSGFVTESYQVDLPSGFERAKQLMDPTIRSTVRRDIGGDEQRIHSMDVKYFDITFKHVLLPVWISAYRYRGKTYRFLINARTGEVQGDRPYSAIKIVLFVFMILAILLSLVLLFGR